jgi:hypothetical protein
MKETMAEAAARRRCPDCGKWYMGTAQRDTHVAKVHPEREDDPRAGTDYESESNR